MLIHEFEERTGFRPTEQHYEVIEDYYNADDRGKDEFCKAFKSGCDPMTDADAKKLLHDWFGFDKSKVEICHAAPREIISRDGRIKEVGTESRKPLYGATDFYYIRFTACGFIYEAVSGKLTVV